MKALLFYEPKTAFMASIKESFPEANPSEVIYSAVVFRKEHLLDLK